MKKTSLLMSGIILTILISLGCSGNVKNANESNTDSSAVKANTTTDISGTYKMPANTCGFELIITKENDQYGYNIKGKNGIVDIYGKLAVSTTDGTTYVIFTLPESFTNKTAEGVLANNTITIQNYGNTMNEYHIFTDCDDKFMEFIK